MTLSLLLPVLLLGVVTLLVGTGVHLPGNGLVAETRAPPVGS
ncbi:hypothetical protein ACFU98_16460 [Streptomyces sp. NPDC057575]